MSTATAPTPIPAAQATVAGNPEAGHKLRLLIAYLIAIALIIGLGAYGLDYYVAGPHDRPFMAKHVLLKPSGRIGINLGILGVGMFLVIFLYPLRKRWTWLGRIGLSRNWLDFHVLLGLSAPFVIAMHSSFKFHGFAGIAFWIMLAVALSGVVGRYLYGQIPRRVNAAEFSRKELQDIQDKMAEQLAGQKILKESDVRSALRLPSQPRPPRFCTSCGGDLSPWLSPEDGASAGVPRPVQVVGEAPQSLELRRDADVSGHGRRDADGGLHRPGSYRAVAGSVNRFSCQGAVRFSLHSLCASRQPHLHRHKPMKTLLAAFGLVEVRHVAR